MLPKLVWGTIFDNMNGPPRPILWGTNFCMRGLALGLGLGLGARAKARLGLERAKGATILGIGGPQNFMTPAFTNQTN